MTSLSRCGEWDQLLVEKAEYCCNWIFISQKTDFEKTTQKCYERDFVAWKKIRKLFISKSASHESHDSDCKHLFRNRFVLSCRNFLAGTLPLRRWPVCSHLVAPTWEVVLCSEIKQVLERKIREVWCLAYFIHLAEPVSVSLVTEALRLFDGRRLVDERVERIQNVLDARHCFGLRKFIAQRLTLDRFAHRADETKKLVIRLNKKQTYFSIIKRCINNNVN